MNGGGTSTFVAGAGISRYAKQAKSEQRDKNEEQQIVK
jgi:hypothetical protein